MIPFTVMPAEVCGRSAEGFPEDITILCHNCNCSRGQYGGCPHQADFNPRYQEV